MILEVLVSSVLTFFERFLTRFPGMPLVLTLDTKPKVVVWGIGHQALFVLLL